MPRFNKLDLYYIWVAILSMTIIKIGLMWVYFWSIQKIASSNNLRLWSQRKEKIYIHKTKPHTYWIVNLTMCYDEHTSSSHKTVIWEEPSGKRDAAKTALQTVSLGAFCWTSAQARKDFKSSRKKILSRFKGFMKTNIGQTLRKISISFPTSIWDVVFLY